MILRLSVLYSFDTYGLIWILSMVCMGVPLTRMYDCCVLSTAGIEAVSTLSMVLRIVCCSGDVWLLRSGDGTSRGVQCAFNGGAH